MKKAIFAKTAAVCGAAMLSLTGFSAFAQKDTPVEEIWGIDAEKVNVAAGDVEAEQGEVVKFPVYLVNNLPEGFTNLEIEMYYDERLTPVLTEDGNVTVKKGEVCDKLTCVFAHDAERCKIKMNAAGTAPEKDSGLMFTVELTVPSDDAGIFPVVIWVRQFNDAKAEEADTVEWRHSGYVKVSGTPKPPVRGDVNRDGEVTIDDAALVADYYMQCAANRTYTGTLSPEAGDVDRDGAVSWEDVQYIAWYFAETLLVQKLSTWGEILDGGPYPLLGNVNSDGTVDVSDAQIVLNYYAKRLTDPKYSDDTIETTTADIDQNGEISVEDAQYILQYYVKNTLAHQKKAWIQIICDN
ncbi:MAG: hypothetical protein IJM46_02160 [Oscillospiraceae bacterium]|nr:hypothetical protein [Oscillospiraceae bacterium]